MFSSIEICAGGGGQALGLELAGWNHVGLIEVDSTCCSTLRTNRPEWNVIEGSVADFDGRKYTGVSLVSGGVPCQPFSVLGKRDGKLDSRDLFPEAIRIVSEINPKYVALENVSGIFDSKFDTYRSHILSEFDRIGYRTSWSIINCYDYGNLQPRRRSILLAEHKKHPSGWLDIPLPKVTKRNSLFDVLGDITKENGWESTYWESKASKILSCPVLVGGSKKHGGPSLGSVFQTRVWSSFGFFPKSMREDSPASDHPVDGNVYLTLRMIARIQEFPDDWKFSGKKTAIFKQIVNALPVNVAKTIYSKSRLMDLLW